MARQRSHHHGVRSSGQPRFGFRSCGPNLEGRGLPAIAVARRQVGVQRLALALVDGDQLGQRDAQSDGELEQHTEGRVDLAALDRADVVAVQGGVGAELLWEIPRRARSSRRALPSACSSGCA
jgi:hypothetical protein